MKGARQGLPGHSKGQSIAEFALVLPVFLLLTIVVIDGARAFMAQISLVNGVREATLFAVQGHYGEWCRSPSDGGAPTVACPAGADSENYAPDPGNMAYRVAGEASGLDLSRITLMAPLCSASDVAPSQSCDAVPDPFYVEVRATYAFDPITPGLSAIWGSTITLTANSTGRLFHL
jgi:hypothetical protein